MAVTGLNRPDVRTISDVRKRHLAALSDLFVQGSRLCQRTGLVGLGHGAVDGTKRRANASRHKAMSHRRMASEAAKLAAEVKTWLEQAEAADQAEDARHGPRRRGDERPAWVANKRRRLERIRQAKAQLDAEAGSAPADLDPDGPGPSSGLQERGARKPTPSNTPPDKAPRNFTDGDSRIMPSQGGVIAGDNAQIAVDAAHRVITAQRRSTNPADFAALVPLIEPTRATLGRNPREVSGDTGIASEANSAAMLARTVNACLCPGRIRHGSTAPTSGRVLKRTPLMQGMAETLRRAGRRSRYRLRKQGVEPVMGQQKSVRGFQQCLLRGLQQVRGEWAMVCTVHNLTKRRTARA